MDKSIREDDFIPIYEKFTESGKSFFNPAHAIESTINDVHYISQTNIGLYKSYNNDTTKTGDIAKLRVTNMLKCIDNVRIPVENITLTPSITSSSIITLKALKEKGVNRVWLETPCYYATIFQAKSLNIDVSFIPSWFDNDFQWQVPDIKKNEAVWVTQPRISLCKNQEEARLRTLINMSDIHGVYLIIDEATELGIPSLATKLIPKLSDRIIRLKGIYKPICINGPRIAYILHGESFGKEIKKWIWTFFGGIDNFSLNSLPSDENEINIYTGMIEATHSQCKKNYMTLKTHSLGTQFTLPQYENGYTTVLIITLSEKGCPIEFENNRQLLIEKLMHIELLPTFGASMYFANDNKHEYIRVNLLTDISKLLHIISKI